MEDWDHFCFYSCCSVRSVVSFLYLSCLTFLGCVCVCACVRACAYMCVCARVCVCWLPKVICWNTVGERLIRRIRHKFFHSVLHHDIAWFDTHQTGELASRLTKYETANIAFLHFTVHSLFGEVRSSWIVCFCLFSISIQHHLPVSLGLCWYHLSYLWRVFFWWWWCLPRVLVFKTAYSSE